jgi:eukaryotic translation initiation factor 2C
MALDVIIGHKVSTAHVTVGRSFFTQKEASPITGRAEDIINPPVPNIDLSAIAFYQGGPHIQIVTKYWDSDLLTNYVGAFLKGTIKWLRKQSKTSKIKGNHRNEARTSYNIERLTQTSASQTMFKKDDDTHRCKSLFPNSAQ